jgi:hypothetical protein
MCLKGAPEDRFADRGDFVDLHYEVEIQAAYDYNAFG